MREIILLDMGDMQLMAVTTFSSNLRTSKKRYAPTIILVNGFLLAVMLICRDAICQLNTRQVAFICTFIVLAEFVVLISTSSKGLWSVSACYLSVFLLFHFGLTSVYAAGISIESFLPSWYSSDWFYSEDTKNAIYLCALGFVACVTGIYAARCSRLSLLSKKKMSKDNLSEFIGPLGFFLVIVGIGLWIFSILRIGTFALLIGSYSTYLETVSGSVANNAFFSIGLGLIFVTISKPCIWRSLGLCLFALWALVAFPLGLRGEILFPSVTALAICAGRKIPFKPVYVVLAAFLMLCLIAFVKEQRAHGLGSIEWSTIVMNPVNGVAEMGV
jgi:hypothetical protein